MFFARTDSENQHTKSHFSDKFAKGRQKKNKKTDVAGWLDLRLQNALFFLHIFVRIRPHEADRVHVWYTVGWYSNHQKKKFAGFGVRGVIFGDFLKMSIILFRDFFFPVAKILKRKKRGKNPNPKKITKTKCFRRSIILSFCYIFFGTEIRPELCFFPGALWIQFNYSHGGLRFSLLITTPPPPRN